MHVLVERLRKKSDIVISLLVDRAHKCLKEAAEEKYVQTGEF